jgi:NhaP-type Na+/H+ or K+/H+ antiporter
LTFGLVLGNARTIAKGLRIKRGVSGLERETLDFNAHVSFFVRVFFFVFLGTLVTLSNIWLLLYGAILAILLFGVRALAVKISTSKLKLTKIERKIMCCMLPRGLAAAVLVSMPYLKYGIAGAQIFTDIVFSVIISTAIISTVGIFVFTHPKEEA